jgi:hypothetical protein
MSADVALPEGVIQADTRCPHCRRRHHHQVHPSGIAPADGDYTVCCGCRAVLMFKVSPLGVILGVSALSPTELATALAEPEVKEALAALAESYTVMQALQLRRAGGRHT